jgi:hypothetical protein
LNGLPWLAAIGASATGLFQGANGIFAMGAEYLHLVLGLYAELSFSSFYDGLH